MLLLQFSTSHYCRKARLALGYKQVAYRVQNLTPGLHALRLKPMTGLTTVPVLLPERSGEPEAIADSTRILRFLERVVPDPPLGGADPRQQQEIDRWEDWFDESIGTATRFLYYQYRSGDGRQVNPSWFAQFLVGVVRRQYGIDEASANLARERLAIALQVLEERWRDRPYAIGDRLTMADIATAALLSPLALIPEERDRAPWLFERIAEVHKLCREPLPPGLES